MFFFGDPFANNPLDYLRLSRVVEVPVLPSKAQELLLKIGRVDGRQEVVQLLVKELEKNKNSDTLDLVINVLTKVQEL